MTQGECVFYLREIHGHWANTNVSAEKLGQLAEANLIEIQPGLHVQARLTKEGKQCKLDGRSHYHTSLPLVRSQKNVRRPMRQRAQKATKPRPLV